MTIRLQISDKRGDAILLATVEGDDPIVVEQDFAEAVALVGLARSYSSFDTAAAAPAVVHAAFPGAAQVPAAAGFVAPVAQPGGAPACQHGTKILKEGVSAKGPWKAWACPGKSSDPTRCSFDFIR